MVKDARLYFDNYTVQNSSIHELVEVLQYSYIYGSRCFGYVLKLMNHTIGEKLEVINDCGCGETGDTRLS